MIILGLDLSTRTGFALGATGGRPYSWTENLRVTDDLPARAVRRFGCVLRDQIEACQRDGRPINLVAYERPLTGAVISRMAGRSQSFIGDMLHHFAGATEAVAACYGIRTESVAVQTVRKAFIGNARADNPKRRVMAQCRLLGWGSPGFDDNEADAMAVWYWACLTHAPKEAPVVGPLFVGAEGFGG